METYYFNNTKFFIEERDGKYRFYIPSLRPAFQYGGWQEKKDTSIEEAKRMIGG